MAKTLTGGKQSDEKQAGQRGGNIRSGSSKSYEQHLTIFSLEKICFNQIYLKKPLTSFQDFFPASGDDLNGARLQFIRKTDATQAS